MLRLLLLLKSFFAASNKKVAKATCEHVIFFKFSHTGSTWLVDELNGVSGFSIIPEFLTGTFAQSGVTAARQVAKDAADARRVFSELLAKPCAKDERVVGFAQNPIHSTLLHLDGFSWDFLSDLQRSRPFIVVSWTRTNLVSRARAQFYPKGPALSARRTRDARRCDTVTA